MTTQNLPGTDAARHGTGDADLTIMIAAHDAFRRDLTRLARTASAANDPARRHFAATGGDRVADVIDALTTSLTGHLRHEERDGLPLIGVALSAGEWRGVGRKMASKSGLSAGAEMFAWILDGTDRDHSNATLAQLPPPLRLLYRARWKPRYEKTPRW